MTPKLQHHITQETEREHEPEPETETPVKDDTDICQQLMSRYSASKAPQHRHLLATAAAIRSILSAESLPLTPPSYFAAAIENLADSKALDSTAIASLLSLVSIVTPLISENGIKGDNGREAVGVLVEVMERGGLGVASVSGVLKCLGLLIVRFCDLEDWSSVKEGFETLLNFSVDKRPKVRKSAQECLEKVFKSFQSSAVTKEASKVVHTLLKSHMAVALTLIHASIVDGSKDGTLPKPEHQEILHVLNLLKLTVPHLSVKISSKILSELLKLMCSQFSILTRHIFKIIEVFFETSRDEIIGPHIENIINSLSLYVSLRDKNPMDTVMPAVTLLRTALDRLHAGGSSSWIRNFLKICDSVAGLLISEATTASQASNTMVELINHHVDERMLLINENQLFEDASQESEEVDMIKTTCSIIENAMSSCSGIPNEHLLGVISVLFYKLRERSFVFMKSIVLRLANMMNHASCDAPDASHLQNCIGSAVVAMGPERMLELIPISIDAEDFTCSNMWLLPILKNHVIGSSLEYYMEHVVPLAKSFQRASHKVKRSVIGQDLQAHAYGLWGLLPAFCRYPIDCHRKFRSFAEYLITSLRDSSMHQDIAIALQALVNQNRRVLISENNAGESNGNAVKDLVLEFRSVPSYSKKTATKNIRALASCSTELLQALADLFVDLPPEKRSCVKDAIGCLASITDSSVTKRIFTSLLEKFQFVNGGGEFEKLESHSDELIDNNLVNLSAKEKNAERFVIMELASSFIEWAKEDLIDLIYNFVVHIFQTTDVTGHCEAYHTLSRILEQHVWFCSSRSLELVDLLHGLKPPIDVASLRNRLACFHILMVNMLQTNLEEENSKAFLILNEIIITLKDAKEEIRRVAYDTLLAIFFRLRNTSCVRADEPCHKLISMIMGYLSGSSPHIKSGAVSALSILVYNDTGICLMIPDLVPSLLSLLQNKAVEIIKAVLGFTKVLVSCLQAKDIQNLLSEIINQILPWSSSSRHHFRSKVTTILEITIRKCGSAAVELVTPEKYKYFLKTVLQKRNNKSTSKEVGATDMETLSADPSSKRLEKQKRKEMDSVPKGNSSVHHRKRKIEMKQNESRKPRIAGDYGGPEGAKRARLSKYQKSRKDQPGERGKKRNLGRDPAIVRKRKMAKRKTSTKNEMAVHKADSASKLQRR